MKGQLNLASWEEEESKSIAVSSNSFHSSMLYTDNWNEGAASLTNKADPLWNLMNYQTTLS